MLPRIDWSRLTATRSSLVRIVAAVALVLSAAACCSLLCLGGGEVQPSAQGLCEQSRGAAPPELADAPKLEPLTSHLAVDVSVSTERVKREISAQVPVVLAEVKGQDIGTPGRVSYVVKRGDFDLGLDEGRLTVTTGVSARVAVCKPFGAFCPTYGRCRPEFVARASVPLVLTKDYGLGPSQVDVKVTRPCVIAVFDATSELRRIARGQSREVKRRIDSALPSYRSRVAAVYKQLQTPFELKSGACLHVAPEAVSQSRPRLKDAKLSSALAVSGKLEVQSPCQKSGDQPRPLPVPKLVEKLEQGIVLELPIILGWEQLSAGLSESLSAGPGAEPKLWTKIERAIARGALADQQPVVALRLELAEKDCDNVWLLAQPYYDKKRRQLRLKKLRLPPGEHSEPAKREAQELSTFIERRASVPLPVDLRDAAQTLTQAAERMTAGRPEGVSIELDLKPARILRVAVARRGLAAIAKVTGTARVSAK